MQIRKFKIHGDNIVECQRTIDLISIAYQLPYKGPIHSVVCPTFYIETSSGLFEFTFIPGYKRWDQDIISYLKSRGGVLREGPDAILTEVIEEKETVLLALEYSGSLSAGNQSWQRHGRAFSVPRAGLPYLYIAELGGYELDTNRKRKGARDPNPAIPFSYFNYAFSQKMNVYPVYVPNPGMDSRSRERFNDIFGEKLISDILRAIIEGENPERYYLELNQKTLDLVYNITKAKKTSSDTLTLKQWGEIIDNTRSGKLVKEYLATQTKMEWKKRATLKGIRDTFRSLLLIASKYGTGITSSTLPLCIIPADRRAAFAKEVFNNYPQLPESLKQWLNKDSDLVICWVAGFKPKGEDSRPDRGLLALARMLIGEHDDVLTVIYGPAKESTWRNLDKAPETLYTTNGLWEAIFSMSDALLIDSHTDVEVNKKGYIKEHWMNAMKRVNDEVLEISVTPIPIKFGEDDVDTILHILFSLIGSEHIFEGLCNPPGGDWSGMSILSTDKQTEFRWLSLPRVSGESSKRPDHVFQIFDIDEKPIVLSIESKEKAKDIDLEIGPRLSRYVENLIQSEASAERALKGSWEYSNHSYPTQEVIFASSAAFLDTGDSSVMTGIIERSGCDIIFGVEIQNTGKQCTINVLPLTDLGHTIAKYVESLHDKHPSYKIKIIAI